MTTASVLRPDHKVKTKTQTKAQRGISELVCVAVIFGVALSLRLLYLYQSPQTPIVGDAEKYYEAGRALSTGTANQEIWPLLVSRGPIYPLFLSAIFSSFTVDLWPVRFIQAGLGALSCVVIYWIGRQLVDRSVALIAGLLMAVTPNLILYTGRILTETLSILLFWLGVAALIQGLRHAKTKLTSGRSSHNLTSVAAPATSANNRPDALTFFVQYRGVLIWFIISGVVMGLACVTRSTLLPNVPFLALAIVCGMPHATKMQLVKLGGIFLAGIFTIVFTWNFLASTIGRTQTAAGSKGVMLMVKNAVQAASPLVRGWAPDTKPPKIVEHWDEVLRQNPVYPFAAAGNLIFYHLWYADNVWREKFLLSTTGMNWLQRVLLLLSLGGVGFALTQWRVFAPLLVLIPPFVYLTIKWIELRHNLPFLPVIFLFAGLFAANLITWIRNYSDQKKNLIGLAAGAILTAAIFATSQLVPPWLCGHPAVWGGIGDAAIMALGLLLGGIISKLTAPWFDRAKSLFIGFVPAVLFIMLFGSHIAVGSEPRWRGLQVEISPFTGAIVQKIYLPAPLSTEQVESAAVLVDLQTEIDPPPLKVGVNGIWLSNEQGHWQQWFCASADANATLPAHRMCALYDVVSNFAGRSLATWPQWWGLAIDRGAVGERRMLSLSLAWHDQTSGLVGNPQVKLGGTYSLEAANNFYGPSLHGLRPGVGTSVYRWSVTDDWRLWETSQLASLSTKSYWAPTDSTHLQKNEEAMEDWSHRTRFNQNCNQLGVRLLVKFRNGRELIY